MSKQYTRLSKVLAKSLHLSPDDLAHSFRPASSEEIPEISRMRRQVFGKAILADDEAYLSWRYFERDEYGSNLWVFMHRGRLVGALGCEPVELSVDGKQIPAVRNMDAMVLTEYNGSGLGAWMTLAMQENNHCILVTGHSDDSASMLAKLYDPLPVRRTFKLIFSSRTYLDSRLPKALITFLEPVLDGVLRIFYDLKRLRIKDKKGVEHRVMAISEFLDLMPENSGGLCDIKVVRSRALYRWRYQQKKRHDFYVVCSFVEDELVAYAIFTLAEAAIEGEHAVGFVVDWDILSPAIEGTVLAKLFALAGQKLRAMGAGQVQMILNDAESANAAKSAGFSERDVESSFYVFCRDEQLARRLRESEDWFHSLLDFDGP